MASSSAFELGFLLGVLVTDGHFGGDGRQPQLTLKAHVRHEPMLRYLLAICEGGRLYGPYHHGEREYYQLMFRGKALRDSLMPILERLPWQNIDPYSYSRYAAMKERYAGFLKPLSSSTAAVSPESLPVAEIGLASTVV